MSDQPFELDGISNPAPEGDSPPPAVAPVAVDRAFGQDNRARLLEEYFAPYGTVEPGNAWKHTYRLLLWLDRTTGLAHCYESDKSQAGRPWYARSLAFHDWVSASLDVDPRDLGEHIDVLFRRASADLAAAAANRRARLAESARKQRSIYLGRGMPEPGEDPELEEIVTAVLDPYLVTPPPAEVMRNLTERIQAHVGQENKRKNLVGEGFEDAIAALLRRVTGVPDVHDIYVRPSLHDLPGFRPPRAGSKKRQVDLALVHRVSGYRTLVSCKWSVRSDREEQFASDFSDYAELEDAGKDFSYVLVTNEFDPARLAAACDMRRQNAPLFTDVVHVNPQGVLAAYSDRGSNAKTEGGQARASRRISEKRVQALGSWLGSLATA
ncbi:hypothetical protein [Pseudokineococcus lusitanus]|uniref:Restriction endonuclease n=1 Tax=Pseudokineococcus lusitanus TaxID=763993 RepID=A0A3N1GWV1_9ACTN|nr:hypothetical protein [Pseudokineococcus lusitanus]ROP34602.1 hypothetical protein EDC03_2418 [Pseudokineococcus lusitanus]